MSGDLLTSRRRTWAAATAGAAGLGAALALASLLGRALTKPLNHDEHPYVAVAALLADGRLYRDFGYNHMPYLPHVYRAVWQAAPGWSPLLAGRVLTFLFLVVTGLALAYVAARLGRRAALGGLAMALFALNTLVVSSDTVPIKDFAALAAVMVAAAATISALSRPAAGRVAFMAAGLAAGAAIGFKLPYLAFTLPIAAAIGCAPPPPGGHRVADRLAPFALGWGLGVLPLAAWLVTYPDVFWFCNVTYHRLYAENFMRNLVPGHGVPGLAEKAAFVYWLVVRDFSIVGLAASTALLALAVGVQRLASNERPGWSWEGVLAGGGLAVAVALALAPAPSWPHHFTLVVPWAIVAAAACHGRLAGDLRPLGHVALAVALASALAQTGRTGMAAVAAVADPARWTSTHVARTGDAIRAALGPPAPGDRIATLAPIFAVTAGYGLYPELATGPFFYAVGSMVPPADRPRFHVVTPDALEALLAPAPPRGILTGHERRTPEGMNLDAPFEAFARRRGYRELPLRMSGLTLFVRAD